MEGERSIILSGSFEAEKDHGTFLFGSCQLGAEIAGKCFIVLCAAGGSVLWNCIS